MASSRLWGMLLLAGLVCGGSGCGKKAEPAPETPAAEQGGAGEKAATDGGGTPAAATGQPAAAPQPQTPAPAEAAKPETVELPVTAPMAADLRLISDDFSTAVVINPASIFGSPVTKAVWDFLASGDVGQATPMLDAHQKLKQETGVDFRMLQQVILLSERPAGTPGSSIATRPGSTGTNAGVEGNAPGMRKAVASVRPTRRGSGAPADYTPPKDLDGASPASPATPTPTAPSPGLAATPWGNLTAPTGGGAMIVRNRVPFDRSKFPDANATTKDPVDPLSPRRFALSQAGVKGEFVDAQTLVIAREALLDKMLGTTRSENPLTQQLAGAGAHDLLLIVDVTSMRSSLATLAKTMPAVAPLAGLAGQVKWVTLKLDISSGASMLELSVVGETPEAVSNLHSLLGGQVQTLKEQLTKELPAADQVKPEIKPLVDAAQGIIQGITLQPQESQLVFSIPRPGNADELAKALPALFEQGRQLAARGERSANLRQLGLAHHNYVAANGCFPTVDGSGRAGYKHGGLSWRVYLLPYLGEEALFKQFKLNEPWDSPHNKTLITKMPRVFGKDKDGKTRIHLFTGPDTPFQPGKGIRLVDVKDGTDRTLLLVEAGPDKAEPWTKPTGLPFDPKSSALNALGTLEDEFPALFMDGSVRWIQKSVNTEIFTQIIPHADGKPTERPAF